MTKLVLSPDKSRVRIRTFAEGLFSRLAHDLELVCRDLSGNAERADDGSGTATLEIPIARIDVSGTLKDGRVDPGGLSSSDRNDCLAKMRKDVFHASGDRGAVVRVEASVASGRARIRIIPPNGRTLERDVSVRLEHEADNGARASGSTAISLEALGSAPVKGPMNAFRMKDQVEVHFELVLEAR